MQLRFLCAAGLLLWLGLSGCLRDTSEVVQPDLAAQFSQELRDIRDYVADNNLDGYYTPDSVFISLSDEGEGTDTPNLNSNVTVIYRGYLLDGTEFDSSNGEEVTFPLRNLIRGWQIALQEFPRGAQATILIPSVHGYGARDAAGIPPYSTLVFDLTLVDFD